MATETKDMENNMKKFTHMIKNIVGTNNSHYIQNTSGC